MSDSFPGVDYGEQLVARYRASGLTRKEFAARAVSLSAGSTQARREGPLSVVVEGSVVP
jgi:hypothetical protein